MRAFSLIETMIVVAILGVFAALAMPSLLPEIHKAQLQGTTEAAANLLARARMEAMLSKRCTQVRLEPGPPQRLIAERLNNFDCENPADGTRIDSVRPLWEQIDWLEATSANVTFSFDQTPAAPGNSIIRFRPNGRVLSADGLQSAPTLDLTNDDALLKTTHSKLAAPSTRKVLVDGNGLICALPRGVDPVGGPPNYSCPN